MLSHVSAGDRWLRHLAFGTVLSLALAGSPSLAAAADQPVVRVVGCNPSSLKNTFQTNIVQATADSADQENDNEAEDGPDSGDAGDDGTDQSNDQQQPPIHGSIALPGVNEDDSKAIAAAIAAKGLSTITSDAATAAAKAALTDAGQRTFKKPVLQTENEQAVWSVETSSKGVNPSLELKVDAGNGNILSMECD